MMPRSSVALSNTLPFFSALAETFRTGGLLLAKRDIKASGGSLRHSSAEIKKTPIPSLTPDALLNIARSTISRMALSSLCAVSPAAMVRQAEASSIEM